MRAFGTPIIILCLLWNSRALGLEVIQFQYLGKTFTAAKVQLSQDDLRLFWKKENVAYQFFDRLALDLKKDQRELLFAMNAGMYMEDHSPLGLYIENSIQKRNLNLKSGYGNFYLKPNGVFLIDQKNQAMILESTQLDLKKITPKWATQSGPMLVMNGKIHSGFSEKSKNILIRNGIGVDENQTVYMVISNDPVSFHEFARLFRDHFKCPDALYLDGSVSQIHSVQLKRFDRYVSLGPMFGVVRKVNP